MPNEKDNDNDKKGVVGKGTLSKTLSKTLSHSDLKLKYGCLKTQVVRGPGCPKTLEVRDPGCLGSCVSEALDVQKPLMSGAPDI